MLTENEIKEIQLEMARAETPRAAILDALKVVQRHRGWVSNESVADIAELTGFTASEIDSIATFYSLIYRRKVGRHVILLCDSVSCWITGYEDLLAHLKSRLGVEFGQTTPDERFTLLPVVCLGACEQAPVMMIDEDLHGNLDAAKIDAMLAKYT
ncbi:MAG: NADH-quinone oxidoreductase subunit NuoE [Planctomycetaceae bacterium]|nr:MAG: NADH-quinone oxidoreductase subunit NuoE [Planctomycetaceae bacterium]